MQLLDAELVGAMKANPKWLVGYSDITLLHFALLKAGVCSLHAPMLSSFARGAFPTQKPPPVRHAHRRRFGAGGDSRPDIQVCSCEMSVSKASATQWTRRWSMVSSSEQSELMMRPVGPAFLTMSTVSAMTASRSPV